MALRARVFVEEQGVDAALEFDGLDDTCRHYRSTLGQEIVATARVRWLDGAAKIQRVAVAKAVRGRGVGAALMRHILADVGDSASEAVLDSQVGAIGFYERLGFSAEGPEFLDAGIPHRRMRRPL
ncbi:MAG: GNAT family N-acetyltransferase [Pseudomonadota bacterium]